LIRAGGIAALLAASLPASAAENVDLKLVLATDVSGSISNDELWLERQGTAAAFLDPDVIKAIENGALGRIAVAMLDFSSPGFGKTVIGWRIVQDRASAASFARAILAVPRTPGNRTSISNALEIGAQLIEASGKEIIATRKVIDIAGDGPNNDGKPVQEIHKRLTARGIVVNGLPIMDENANGYFPGLDRYYQACVAGGRGAFVIVVRSFRDFGAAMRRKLILEISQDERRILPAFDDTARSAPLRLVAATQYPLPQAPTLLRPNRNEYSNACQVPDAQLRSGKQ
jgi:hypothetical protein